MKDIKKYLLILLTLCFCSYLTKLEFISQEDSAQNTELFVPPHLRAARELLEGVKPENNSYRHRPSVVLFPGEKNSSKYVCHTDCSGLIDGLLTYVYGYTPHEFREWTKRRRALSSSYFLTISRGFGFLNILNINEVLPGDLISYKLPPGSKNFGHVMLVDEKPVMRKSIPPLVPNTIQWAVTVIDCTGRGHGLQDTRYLKKGKFHSGIGRGVIRLYTNSEGELVGFAWSFLPKEKFYDTKVRPIVIGRLIPGFHP